jgi:hypothetical protein
MALGSAAIVQLIMLVSDLLILAPVQYAKIKGMVADGSLTDQQVDNLILAAEKDSDTLIAEIDNL